jgi:hypothetical protein
MDHPLIGDINNLTTEELGGKVTELNKKLAIAYRLGNHHLCNQIRMAIETYQNKYQEKLKSSQSGTDYDGMIDIS